MRKIIWGCILAVIMTVILGCNNTSAEAASAISLMIDGNKVNKSTYNVTAGETVILTVDTGKLKNVKSISYKSTGKSVASVTKDGTIEAKKKGSAKIKVTVKYGKKTRKSWVKILVEDAKPVTTEDIVRQEGNYNMVMMIGDTKVDVTWENNASVDELKKLASEGLTIPMSMYGGFEQVGSIGKSITRNDKQTTTSAGDIVLYSGNQLVVFYGSNSWSYTRLGKIDLSVEELTKLLSNGDVTVTLTNGEKDTPAA
ncbi:MAG: Ig-like domain-containing protein [Lachnospiraceae bacterium]|nr:Ig-like domain-containing protein [Lachnospiraceae bacterium]